MLGRRCPFTFWGRRILGHSGLVSACPAACHTLPTSASIRRDAQIGGFHSTRSLHGAFDIGRPRQRSQGLPRSRQRRVRARCTVSYPISDLPDSNHVPAARFQRHHIPGTLFATIRASFATIRASFSNDSSAIMTRVRSSELRGYRRSAVHLSAGSTATAAPIPDNLGSRHSSAVHARSGRATGRSADHVKTPAIFQIPALLSSQLTAEKLDGSAGMLGAHAAFPGA